MQADHTSKMIQYQKAGIGSLIADLLQNLNKRNLKRRQKRLWAQYQSLTREEETVYSVILEELRLQDAGNYIKLLRMNADKFEALVTIL